LITGMRSRLGRCLHAVAERVGPAIASVLVRNVWSEASENLLWAMAAGLKDQDARDLPQNEKNRLRKECQRLSEGR